MRYYITQNVSIIIAAVGVFILSLSMGLLIYSYTHDETQRVSVISVEEAAGQKKP